jgi:hypothetical protein
LGILAAITDINIIQKESSFSRLKNCLLRIKKEKEILEQYCKFKCFESENNKPCNGCKYYYMILDLNKFIENYKGGLF